MSEPSTITLARPGTKAKRWPQEPVSEVRRDRMLAAALAAVDDAHMTVAQVINRARVSRKTCRSDTTHDQLRRPERKREEE
jgi:hypothetical protein